DEVARLVEGTLGGGKPTREGCLVSLGLALFVVVVDLGRGVRMAVIGPGRRERVHEVADLAKERRVAEPRKRFFPNLDDLLRVMRASGAPTRRRPRRTGRLRRGAVAPRRAGSSLCLSP